MTLENLVSIGRLKSHEASAEEFSRLFLAARRNLEDAGVAELSSESRFDLGYKAIMQCALLALMANGLRPSTHVPGHHATAIQTLPITIGLSNERMIVLDKLRQKRNFSDYGGQEVSKEEVAACLRAAQDLIDSVNQWLRAYRPELAG